MISGINGGTFCRKAASNKRIRERETAWNHGILLAIGAVLAAPANTLKESSMASSSSGRSFRSLFFICLVVLICGALGAVFGQRIGASSGVSDGSDVSDSLRSFSQVYDLVEQNYAEPVNPDKAIYNGAIPGMLHVLDPHSNFFDPKSYSALREEQRGKY
jgi:hypothetical protein